MVSDSKPRQARGLWHRYQGAYSGLPRAAWILAGVQLVNMCGSMAIFFLTLYLSRCRGWTAQGAGLAMSGYGLGMLGGGLAGGALSDRLGAFRVQRLSLTGSALLLGGLPFLSAPPWIFVGVVGLGFSAAALWPASAAAMAALCPEESRAKGFVLNRLANNLGVAVGPGVGGLLAQHDYRLLFFVDGGTCLLAAAALLRLFPMDRAQAPGSRAQTPPPGLAWISDRVFLALLAASVGIGLIFSQVFSTFGPYLKLFQGLTESSIGRLIAVNAILIVAAQMPLTHFANRFSGVRVAALGCVALALGFGLMPAGRGFAFMALTVVTWTLGEMLVMPSLTTLISLRAPEGVTGRYMGLHSLSFSVGITLGPALGMQLLQARGGAALWLAVSGCCLCVGALFLLLSRAWNGRST